MQLDVEIRCCLCTNKHETKVNVPDDWGTRYGGLSEDLGFCPDHKQVEAFADAQCPGCVGGWGDCAMWAAFAYSHGRDVTEADLAEIERGFCPHRTNGSFTFDSRTGEMGQFDLSDRAPDGAGQAFADAIRVYVAKYPSEER